MLAPSKMLFCSGLTIQKKCCFINMLFYLCFSVEEVLTLCGVMGTHLQLKYMSCPLDCDGTSLANVSFAAKMCDHNSVGMAYWLKYCPKAQEPGCYSCLYCWPLGNLPQATSSGFLRANEIQAWWLFFKNTWREMGGIVC